MAQTTRRARTTVAPSFQRPLGFVIPAVALLLLLLYAHVQVAKVGEDYSGALAGLDRLFDLLLALGLLGVAYVVGSTVSSKLSLDFISRAENASFSIMLGSGLLGLGLLGLGLYGLLTPLPVVALIILLSMLSWRELARLWRTLIGPKSKPLDKASAANSKRMVILLGIVVLAVLIVRAETPPHSADEAIYHLSVTKLFVQKGRIYPVYDNFSGNMPFLPHMIYAVCLMAKADIAARLFSLLLAVVTATGIFAFCERFLTRRTGLLALFGFFGAGMVVEVAVTSRIDVSLAGMLFMAAYAMMTHLETDHRGWLYVSAALSGFGLGIKYSAALWIALIGVMYLFETILVKRRPLLVAVRRGILYLGIATAIASPWYLKNLVWFNNPVYPYVTGEVAESSGGQVRYFTADDNRKIEAHFEWAERDVPAAAKEIEGILASEASYRPVRHPFRFWEYFTKPDVYNPAGVAEAYQNPNYLFFGAPLILLIRPRRWVLWLGFLSASFYLCIASTSWMARYLLPVYPALTIVSVCALGNVADRLRKRAPIAALLPLIAVAVTVASTTLICALQTYKAGGMSFIFGALSRRDFMQAVFYYPPIDYINHHLPRDARVMMIGAQMGYDMQREYLADAGWDAIEWQRSLIRANSIEGVNQYLKERGITHILFCPGLFKYVARMGRDGSGPSGSQLLRIERRDGSSKRVAPDYEAQLENWVTFESYRTKFLEPVFAHHDYWLFKIK